MNELFPIAAGVLFGLLLGAFTARRRLWVWMGASILLGLCAVVVSGEWRLSWAFLLIDVPLVALSAAAAHLAARLVSTRMRARHDA